MPRIKQQLPVRTRRARKKPSATVLFSFFFNSHSKRCAKSIYFIGRCGNGVARYVAVALLILLSVGSKQANLLWIWKWRVCVCMPIRYSFIFTYLFICKFPFTSKLDETGTQWSDEGTEMSNDDGVKARRRETQASDLAAGVAVLAWWWWWWANGTPRCLATTQPITMLAIVKLYNRATMTMSAARWRRCRWRFSAERWRAPWHYHSFTKRLYTSIGEHARLTDSETILELTLCHTMICHNSIITSFISRISRILHISHRSFAG